MIAPRRMRNEIGNADMDGRKLIEKAVSETDQVRILLSERCLQMEGGIM